MAKRKSSNPATDLDEWATSYNLARAQHLNDTKAAREVLNICAQCLENGQPLPQSAKSYLIRAFRQIAKGKSPGKALMVKRKPGRSALANEVRDLRYVTLMHHFLTLTEQRVLPERRVQIGKRVKTERRIVKKRCVRTEKPATDFTDAFDMTVKHIQEHAAARSPGWEDVDPDDVPNLEDIRKLYKKWRKR